MRKYSAIERATQIAIRELEPLERAFALRRKQRQANMTPIERFDDDMTDARSMSTYVCPSTWIEYCEFRKQEARSRAIDTARRKKGTRRKRTWIPIWQRISD